MPGAPWHQCTRGVETDRNF
uniref:Uncharacterized protein n=1 Tax=Arundo donax TaxID=35708 RepID=A0A0A9BCC7_ARUDO